MTPPNTVHLDLYNNAYNESIGLLNENKKIRTVLTVAGSDSSGGAGIEADLKTISAHRCYALTGIDFLTAQNTQGVCNTRATDGEMISSILQQNFSDIPINAIKTGVLTKDACIALKKAMQKYDYTGHLVVDPVLVSTSGCDLAASDILFQIMENLASHISIITPNLLEAKALVNTLSESAKYDNKSVKNLDEIFEMCREIHCLTGIKWILIKGGHQEWEKADLLTDVLFDSEKNIYFVMQSKKMFSNSTHGTGCTLSSAIASNLANGFSMVNAVANGIVYVQKGIQNAPGFGKGFGPLNHIQPVVSINFDVENDAIDINGKTCILDDITGNLKIKNYWSEYINHKFIRSICDFTLPLDKFESFCKQNLKYLIAYAQILALMISKTNDKRNIQSCTEKLQLTLLEINRYEGFLFELGCSESHIAVESNKECSEYIKALFDLSKTSGDFFDIYISLLPCTVGYYIACSTAEDVKNEHGNVVNIQSKLYSKWISGISCAESKECFEKEKIKLESLFRKHCTTQTKFERVLHIFQKSLILETHFLNSLL